jgi:hypothetical protein
MHCTFYTHLSVFGNGGAALRVRIKSFVDRSCKSVVDSSPHHYEAASYPRDSQLAPARALAIARTHFGSVELAPAAGVD